MAFIIGLPVAQIILFCLAIGHDPTGLPIAVTNHELSEGLLAQQECPIYNGCNYTLLSCRYLEFLKNRSVIVVSGSGQFRFCTVMIRENSNRLTSQPKKRRTKLSGGERRGALSSSRIIIRNPLSKEQSTDRMLTAIQSIRPS